MVAKGRIRSSAVEAVVTELSKDSDMKETAPRDAGADDVHEIEARPRRKRTARPPVPAAHRIARIEMLRQLPTMTVEDAAFVLGISRASAYAAVRDGEIKVKIYRGRKLVLTRALFAELGYLDSVAG
jgi:hypothetical protein